MLVLGVGTSSAQQIFDESFNTPGTFDDPRWLLPPNDGHFQCGTPVAGVGNAVTDGSAFSSFGPDADTGSMLVSLNLTDGDRQHLVRTEVLFPSGTAEEERRYLLSVVLCRQNPKGFEAAITSNSFVPGSGSPYERGLTVRGLPGGAGGKQDPNVTIAPGTWHVLELFLDRISHAPSVNLEARVWVRGTARPVDPTLAAVVPDEGSTNDNVAILALGTKSASAARPQLDQVMAFDDAPVDKRYLVGAWYFPNYHPTPEADALPIPWGAGGSEWDINDAAQQIDDPAGPPGAKIDHVQPKKALWGRSDEATPEVMAVKVDAAVEAGIDFFAFDYFWSPTHWKPDHAFNAEPLDQGFLQASNNTRMRFCIMWDHEAQQHWQTRAGAEFGKCLPAIWDPDPDLLEQDYNLNQLATELNTRYFSKPNYLRINGKPVLMFWNLASLLQRFGSTLATKLQEMEDSVGGLHLLVLHEGSHALDNLHTTGFDGLVNYVSVGEEHQNNDPGAQLFVTTFQAEADEAVTHWNDVGGLSTIPFYPTTTPGWDNSPRTDAQTGSGFSKDTMIVTGATADRYRDFVKRGRGYLDSFAESEPALAAPLLMGGTWNELGEGHFLEPDREHGYGKLRALRSACGNQLGEFDALSPWTATDTTPPLVGNGVLSFTTTSTNGMITRNVSLDPFVYDQIEIRMRVGPSGGTGTDTALLRWFSFAPPGSQAALGTKSFPVKADGEFHVYRLPLGRTTAWVRDTVIVLSLRPSAVQDQDVGIDWIVAVTDPTPLQPVNNTSKGLGSSLSSFTTPDTVLFPGVYEEATVTFRNLGTSTWTGPDYTAVPDAGLWLTDPPVLSVPTTIPVPPGGEITIGPFRIQKPGNPAPGDYDCRFSMAHLGAKFGDKAGTTVHVGNHEVAWGFDSPCGDREGWTPFWFVDDGNYLVDTDWYTFPTGGAWSFLRRSRAMELRSPHLELNGDVFHWLHINITHTVTAGDPLQFALSLHWTTPDANEFSCRRQICLPYPNAGTSTLSGSFDLKTVGCGWTCPDGPPIPWGGRIRRIRLDPVVGTLNTSTGTITVDSIAIRDHP
jgi:hypothetical protein